MIRKKRKYCVDGQKLFDARDSKGWDQEFLSKQTDLRADPKKGERAISVRTIRRVEAGGYHHGYTIRQLADALDLRPEELLLAPTTTQEHRSAPESDWQIVEHRLVQALRAQAEDHLANKLHVVDWKGEYQPLDMQVGLTQAQCRAAGVLDQGKRGDSPRAHNRLWQSLASSTLRRPDGIYILSSDTGTGKTTFLRALQLQILDEGEFVPVFLSASQLECLELRDKADLMLHLPGLLGVESVQAVEHDFLEQLSLRAVFLIDGVDQIRGSGTAYRDLLSRLLDVCGERLIIAARPFAVVSHEQDERVKFLRLKLFSEKAQRKYFGNHHERACELCISCSELITVPMLAYMIRTVIESGHDKDIKTRTDLYGRFVNYILTPHLGYSHENLVSDRDIAPRVRQALAKISFLALAQTEPSLQRIPMALATTCAENKHTTVEQILKHGIVTTVVSPTLGQDEYLYFSHQSFQEYLAAEWAVQNETRITRILREWWNPKWKETIKFLAGFIGEPSVRKVYSPERRDDCIHSRVFLAAECCGETRATCGIEKVILRTLKALIIQPPLVIDALSALSSIRSAEAADLLLEYIFTAQDAFERHPTWPSSDDLKLRGTLQPILERMKSKLSDEHKRTILNFIAAREHPLCEELKCVLCLLSCSMTHDDISTLIEYQCQVGAIARLSSLHLDMRERLSTSHIDAIFRHVRGRNSRLRRNALSLLEQMIPSDSEDAAGYGHLPSQEGVCAADEASSRFIRDKITSEHIEAITSVLRRKTHRFGNYSHEVSLGLLCNIAVCTKVPAHTINAIIALLTVEDWRLQERVLQRIAVFCDCITPKHVNTINALLNSQDVGIQLTGLDALASLSARLRSWDIENVVRLLNSDIPRLRIAALAVLRKIPGRLSARHIARVVRLLRKAKDDFAFIRRKLSEFKKSIAPRKITECECCYIGDLYSSDPVGELKAACQVLRAARERVAPGTVRKIIDTLGKNSDTFVQMATEDEEYEDIGINVDLVPLPSRLRTSELKRIVTLLNGEDESTRQAALVFLSSIARTLDHTLIRCVISSLHSDCPETLQLALEVLAERNDLSSTEITAVIPCIGHDHPNVRQIASYCLHRVTTELSAENVSALISLLERDEPTGDFEIGSLLVQKTQIMPPGSLDRILPLLARRKVRMTAARIIEHYASQLSDQQIRNTDVIADSDDPSVRMLAIRLLVQHKRHITARRVNDVIDCLPLTPGCGASGTIAMLTHLIDENQAYRIIQLYLKDPSSSFAAKAVTLLPRAYLARYRNAIMDALDPSKVRLDSSHYTVLAAMAQDLVPQYVAKIADLLHVGDMDVKNRTYTLLKTLRNTGNAFFTT